MSKDAVTTAATEISTLLKRRLRLSGDLATQFRKGRKMMRRRTRRDIEVILAAQKMAQHPKMARQVDVRQVRLAAKNAVRDIKTINRKTRTVNRLLNLGALIGVLIVLAVVGVTYFGGWDAIQQRVSAFL